MELTRRRFLECASGALAMAALPRVSRPFARRGSSGESSTECAILDLEGDCGIAESIVGYEGALARLGVRALRIDARSASPSAMLVVPGALRITPATGAMVRRSLDDGAMVIVESGAGFADPDGAAFRAHRESLREQLQLHIAAPVSLWPRRGNTEGIPYVDYSWPTAARVRDFSRVVPLGSEARADEIIARVDGLPVALMRRSGSGTLVFLGSPLGPALRAGDAEARMWLGDVPVSPAPGSRCPRSAARARRLGASTA
jgi:hypothetical protein